MSAAKDRPISKPPTDEYRCNYERIFGKKDKKEPPKEQGGKEGSVTGKAK